MPQMEILVQELQAVFSQGMLGGRVPYWPSSTQVPGAAPEDDFWRLRQWC